MSFLAVAVGFAMIWHMWALALLGRASAVAAFTVFAWFDPRREAFSANKAGSLDAQWRKANVALTTTEPPARTKAGDQTGPSSKRVTVAYGFWIFLLSDFVLFAGFYAAYAVLSQATAGGPLPRDLFDLRIVAFETACLLLSSFACGMASAPRLTIWQPPSSARGFSGWSSVSSRACWHRVPGQSAAPFCRRSSRWSGYMACMSVWACCGC
jgi:cytochrome o ubiquinol oxidase subunit 1